MKRKVFLILGASLSVLPPALATLSYFPLWVEAGSTQTISGLCALALVICAAMRKSGTAQMTRARAQSPEIVCVLPASTQSGK